MCLYLYLGQIWGNLISSLVFQTDSNDTITDAELELCGANFCPGSDSNNTNLEKPPIEKVNHCLNMLSVSVFFIATLSSVVAISVNVAIFLC